jgi:D-alanine-D-alanine ligase
MSSLYILFGGNGTETKVSVASAQNFCNLAPLAKLFFWNAQGQVLEVSREELTEHKEAVVREFLPQKILASFQNVDKWLSQLTPQQDVVILSLHGGDGENGWLQEKLESRKIFFTGSGAAASRVAIDKSATKILAKKFGVSVASSIVFNTSNDFEIALKDFFQCTQNIVIKPTEEGSSTNLSFIKSREELNQWCSKHSKINKPWIAEEFISGREFTIGIASYNGALMALPASEVILERNATFDYEGKYLGKGNIEVTPAEVTPAVMTKLQSAMLQTFCAVGCYGYARGEVILRGEEAILLEINTLPGFTSRSFIPQQLEAAKISTKDFLNEQIKLARHRYD